MIKEGRIQSQSQSQSQSLSLAEATKALITHYLEAVNNNEITHLHQMVLEEIQPPLLQAVMEQCKYNQSRAAALLGISRGTCRALLIKYFGEKYCPRVTTDLLSTKTVDNFVD